jgi:Flp pilus assembly protein CpaB
MRRGRIFFFLAFILLLFLVAVFLVWQRGILPITTAAQPTLVPTKPPVRVVIVTQNLPKGYKLTDDVLGLIPWDPSSLNPSLFTEEKKDSLINRVTRFSLNSGTPIMDNMLVTEGEQVELNGSPWALNIPPGSVAVSIPIDRLSSVSYAPESGDHVDVIGSMLFVDLDTDFQSKLPNQTGLVIGSGPPDPETGQNPPLTVSIQPPVYGKVVIDPVFGMAVYLVPSEEQRPRLVSQMILQNCIVLRVGDFPLEQEIQPTPTPSTPQQGQNQGGQNQAPAAPPKPVVITLIVNPQDAIALNYLIYSGAQLTLSLRNPNDNDRVNRDAVTLQYLLERYQIPIPVKLPYGVQPRIDNLGTPQLAPQGEQ